MAATADEIPQDVSRMTRAQKLAALLVILGPESAAEILKGFEEHELEMLTGEMTKFAMISREMKADILKEFSDVAIAASTSIRGGVEYARDSLQRAVGEFRATDILGRIAPARKPVAAIDQIQDMDARQIFNLLKSEQPQTVALILSYLKPDKASQTLQMLAPELREQVIERLATLAPTPIEVVEKLVGVLCQKMGSKHTRALNQTGGVKSAAALLNTMDKTLSKTLLVSLEERLPELGQAIRRKMFTFEDMANLDAAALQKVLREVDMRDLAVALKTASEKVKKSLLGCISKRAAEAVNEEMSFMGAVKLKEIEAAQGKIIEVVRKLEDEGEIEIGDGREGGSGGAPG